MKLTTARLGAAIGCLACVGLVACRGSGQLVRPTATRTPTTSSAPGGVSAEEPMRLYSIGLGTFTRAISSTNPDAQAYFNQGFQMMYAFAKPEAIASFREARRRDPSCAICFWGEAWAYGPYLNGPMAPADGPAAYAAAQRALELATHATPNERALIEAMATRYGPSFDEETRAQFDRAYADAMARVAAAYPDDLDAGTLYAEALFLLEPRRGLRDVEAPSVRRLHAELERVLAMNVHHPGACHFYVHATESTVVPERAEACAEFLGRSIPGASHINHMPSHTWNEIGRWGDSVRANIEAWHSDLKAEVGEGFAIYPSHNLHMLFYAASMDGQGAIAIQAAKDYAKLMGDTGFHALTLVRFGRFDEVEAVGTRPVQGVSAGFWDFAQGYSRLRMGEARAARQYLARVREGARSPARFRFHSAADLLGVVGDILEGELDRAAGDLPTAIARFERAVIAEDGLSYDEPEPLPFAARHWLGAALLEAGRPADAERVYREELDDHPHNGWSLIGLRQALVSQQKPTADVDADFASSWARSDTWIRASRF